MFYADARALKETIDKKKRFGPILAIDKNLPWFWITGPRLTDKQFGMPGGQLLIADIHTLKEMVDMFPVDFVKATFPAQCMTEGLLENRIKKVMLGTYRHGKVLSEVFKFVMEDNQIAYYDQQNSCSDFERLDFHEFLILH